MKRTKLHIPSDNLIVEALLSFEIEQSVTVRNQAKHPTGLHNCAPYLLSPLDTYPMLSRGSCLTGLNRSHGTDDFRLSVPRFGGPLAIVPGAALFHFLVRNNQHGLRLVVYSVRVTS